jgi:trehalose 6-phosphate phosphatase
LEGGSWSQSQVSDQYDLCTRFFEQLRKTKKRTLLLDYDGTLAPFTPDRTRAVPYREIPELVGKIMRSGTRVVLVSGRAATELLFLSGIHPHPEIWGSHGAERLYPDGKYEVDSLPLEHKTGLEMAHQSLVSAGLAPRLETKAGGIAVHWRGLSPEERASVESKVRKICASAVADHGFHLLTFDGGLELRAASKHKGDAVAVILGEAGDQVAAAYLGDDQTDENAFRAIKGRGLAILVRGEPRPTLADVWLRPPDELVRFLRDWLKACGAEG